MPPKALLELATDLLHRVQRFDSPADAVLAEFFRRHRELGPRERLALADTVYAVMRERPLFQHLAKSGSGEAERRLAILGWHGNAAFLRAALDEREQQWLAHALEVDRAALPEPLRHNLPDWLAEALRREVGDDDFRPLAEALNRPAPTDLRVNDAKARRAEVQASLAAAGIEAGPTPHSPFGLRLPARTSLHKADAYVNGEVEPQDEGSQLLALLVGARRGEMVADFCAGAGGKTLALGAAMRNTGRLYAFDVSGHRLAALGPRLARSGLSNVHPVQIAHERDERIRRLAGKLDRVLVDAPCTGLGTLRRHPDLKWRQTAATVEQMAVRQAAILQGAAKLVKPGGRLVYATCSLLRAENEAVADAFTAAAEGGWKVVPAEEVLARAGVAQAAALVAGPYLRLWPHRHGTDGYFAAVWEKA